MDIVNTVRSLLMGYTPTQWVTGDVITADKLNHMEEGIADGGSGEPLFVKVPFEWDEDLYTPIISKSFSEILEILDSGKIPYLCNEYEDFGMQCRIIFNYVNNDEQYLDFAQCNLDVIDSIQILSDDSCTRYRRQTLPEIQNGDVGKVLSVNSNLSPAWTQI